LEVIRYTREDRVVASFIENVWAQVERCAGCHAKTAPDIEKNIAKYGTRVLWVGESPYETYRTIVARGYINTADPTNSLFLLKPTMQVEHGGGKKMETGDLGYKHFRQWIEDYTATLHGAYRTTADLPKPPEVEYIGSDIWLKIAPTPDRWGDKVLGVLVFPYDNATGTFRETPVATSDRRVWGAGRLWQHNLILLAPKGSEAARALRQSRQLQPGRYLVRFYLDEEGALERDWQTSLTTPQFFVGEKEIETEWRVGYAQMTLIEP